jgi:hypothetical protein
VSGKFIPLVVRPSEHKTYFIEGEEGKIKIGKAKNVQRRLCQLQTGSASPLKLLHVLYEDREANLHKRFAHLRIPGGEWFRSSPALLEFIQRLKESL